MAVYAPPSPIYGISAVALIVAAFALPIFTLFVKNKRFYDSYAVAFGVFALIVATLIMHDVLVRGAPILYPFGGWPPPLGIVYEVDLFGAVIGLLIASVMLMIIIYSVWYTEGLSGYEWYYTLLLGLEAGMLGVVYTGDVFNLFVMLEVTAISAYGLVAFYRGRAQAVEAAMKYAIIGAAVTTVYFIATVFIYASYQTLHMAGIALRNYGFYHETFPWIASHTLLIFFGNPMLSACIALALSLWAFTYKAALFPNHFWLPDAHPEAPAPVSAALSGLVVKVGVYATARFLYTMFGMGSSELLNHPIAHGIPAPRTMFLIALGVLGAVSAIVGAVMMGVQRDVKRLLAYSTVNHVGFMFMAIAVGVQGAPQTAVALALAAMVFHMINHSIGKSMLFMSTGVMIKARGTRDIDELVGVGRALPVAGIATVIGALNLLGVPPFAGFLSKYLLYQAFLDVGMPYLAVLVVVASALSLLGYAKLIYVAVAKGSKEVAKVKESPLAAGVLIILAAATVVLFAIYPSILRTFFSNVANQLIDPRSYMISYFSTMYRMWIAVATGG